MSSHKATLLKTVTHFIPYRICLSDQLKFEDWSDTHYQPHWKWQQYFPFYISLSLSLFHLLLFLSDSGFPSHSIRTLFCTSWRATRMFLGGNLHSERRRRTESGSGKGRGLLEWTLSSRLLTCSSVTFSSGGTQLSLSNPAVKVFQLSTTSYTQLNVSERLNERRMHYNRNHSCCDNTL